MERLFYIKFYKSDGKLAVRKDYTGLQFESRELTELFIQSEKRNFESIFNIKIKINANHKEIPEFTIKQLIGAYCNVSGFDYKEMIGKGRKREIVNVRKFITKTALDLGFVHGQLRPYFPDGVTYSYEKSFNDMIETSDMAIGIWREYQDKALSQLIDIRKEDGSGTIQT